MVQRCIFTEYIKMRGGGRMIYALNYVGMDLELNEGNQNSDEKTVVMSDELRSKICLIRVTGAAMTCLGRNSIIRLSGMGTLVAVGIFEYWYTNKRIEQLQQDEAQQP